MPIIQGNRPYDVVFNVTNSALASVRKFQSFTKTFTIGGAIRTNGTGALISLGDMTTFYLDATP
jgi:hypothetical protein